MVDISSNVNVRSVLYFLFLIRRIFVDINECRPNGTGECDDICVNQHNSYMCLDICPVGFYWDDAEEKCVGESFHI